MQASAFGKGQRQSAHRAQAESGCSSEFTRAIDERHACACRQRAAPWARWWAAIAFLSVVGGLAPAGADAASISLRSYPNDPKDSDRDCKPISDGNYSAISRWASASLSEAQAVFEASHSAYLREANRINNEAARLYNENSAGTRQCYAAVSQSKQYEEAQRRQQEQYAETQRRQQQQYESAARQAGQRQAAAQEAAAQAQQQRYNNQMNTLNALSALMRKNSRANDDLDDDAPPRTPSRPKAQVAAPSPSPAAAAKPKSDDSRYWDLVKQAKSDAATKGDSTYWALVNQAKAGSSAGGDSGYWDLVKQAQTELKQNVNDAAKDTVISTGMEAINPFRSGNPFSRAADKFAADAPQNLAMAVNTTTVSVGVEYADGLGHATQDPTLDVLHEGAGKVLALDGGNPFAKDVASMSNAALAKIHGQTVAQMNEIGQTVNEITSSGSGSNAPASTGNPLVGGTLVVPSTAGGNPFSTSSRGTSGQSPGAQQYRDPQSGQMIAIPPGFVLYRDPGTLALSVINPATLSAQTATGDAQYGATVACTASGVGIVVPQCEQQRRGGN